MTTSPDWSSAEYEMHQAAYWFGAELARPSTRYRPRLFIDGNQWCALYGDNLQDGVAGFGYSPEAAYSAFDKAWTTELAVTA